MVIFGKISLYCIHMIDLSKFSNPFGPVPGFLGTDADDELLAYDFTPNRTIASKMTHELLQLYNYHNNDTPDPICMFSNTHPGMLRALLKYVYTASSSKWVYVVKLGGRSSAGDGLDGGDTNTSLHANNRAPNSGSGGATPHGVDYTAPDYRDIFITTTRRIGYVSPTFWFFKPDQYHQQQPPSATATTDLCIVSNPNFPLGTIFTQTELLNIVITLKSGATLLIDETYLPYCGQSWTEKSILNIHPIEPGDKTIVETATERGVRILVVNDWTKCFPTSGFGISSVIATNRVSVVHSLFISQFPPMSIQGRNYLLHAFRYSQLAGDLRTMNTWRASTVSKIRVIVAENGWTVCDDGFVPWIWINTHNESVTRTITQKLISQDIFVLSGNMIPGIANSCFAFEVPDLAVALPIFSIIARHCRAKSTDLNYSNKNEANHRLDEQVIVNVTTDAIHPYKQYSVEAYSHYNQIPTADIPPLLLGRYIDSAGNTLYHIIDGHARFKVVSERNAANNRTTVLARIVDYYDPNIFANSLDGLAYTSVGTNECNTDAKNAIVDRVVKRMPLVKSVANTHMVRLDGMLVPIHILVSDVVEELAGSV